MAMTLWAIVPAAGSGRRLAADGGGAGGWVRDGARRQPPDGSRQPLGEARPPPKQYLPLAGATVIEQSLSRLLAVAAPGPDGAVGIRAVVVALAEGDDWFAALAVAAHPRLLTTPGGARRQDSVLRALGVLPARDQDWVLVHDAARPCVRVADVERLITALAGHPVGGLLGAPVTDSLKRVAGAGLPAAGAGGVDTVTRSAAREGRSAAGAGGVGGVGTVTGTLAREGCWRAFTPQLFRYRPLLDALAAAEQEGRTVTDEAGAMEAMGLKPVMVPGAADNIKVTQRDDLALAELILRQQAGGKGREP